VYLLLHVHGDFVAEVGEPVAESSSQWRSVAKRRRAAATGGIGLPRNLIAFGATLELFRTHKGLSQEAVGDRINLSRSAVGKIERGESRCQLSTARELDVALDLPGLFERLWHELDIGAAFPTWFDWHKIEQEATRLRAYEHTVVHGLLQTEDYARALLGGDAEAIESRLERQKILTRKEPPPPHLHVLLSELVFCNPVGGQEVMYGQLKHLLAVSEDPRITVQVIPGMVPPEGNSGNMALASLAGGATVAYMDSALRGISTGDVEDVEHLITAYDALRAKALPEGMSRDLIAKIMEERWT